jgi:hypothetical protein
MRGRAKPVRGPCSPCANNTSPSTRRRHPFHALSLLRWHARTSLSPSRMMSAVSRRATPQAHVNHLSLRAPAIGYRYMSPLHTAAENVGSRLRARNVLPLPTLQLPPESCELLCSDSPDTHRHRPGPHGHVFPALSTPQHLSTLFRLAPVCNVPVKAATAQH